MMLFAAASVIASHDILSLRLLCLQNYLLLGWALLCGLMSDIMTLYIKASFKMYQLCHHNWITSASLSNKFVANFIFLSSYIAVVGNLFTTAGRKRVVILVAGRTHNSSKGTHDVRQCYFFFEGGHLNMKVTVCSWRTKTGGIWCKDFIEKGSLVVGFKNLGLFLV